MSVPTMCQALLRGFYSPQVSSLPSSPSGLLPCLLLLPIPSLALSPSWVSPQCAFSLTP